MDGTDFWVSGTQVQELAIHARCCGLAEEFVVIGDCAWSWVSGGVASVALGLPGTCVVVFVGLGEAAEPSFFVEMRAEVLRTLDFIQGVHEVSGELGGIVRELE